jgi:hypothetical protein
MTVLLVSLVLLPGVKTSENEIDAAKRCLTLSNNVAQLPAVVSTS